MTKYKKSAITLLWCFLIFNTTTAYCQEVAEKLFVAEFGGPAINYGQIVSATIFLIVFIIFALLIFKKSRFSVIANQSLLEVVHRYSISSKEKLLIVRAGSDYLLLSSSSAGVRKLHIMDANDISKELTDKNVNSNEFANIFVNLIGKNRNA